MQEYVDVPTNIHSDLSPAHAQFCRICKIWKNKKLRKAGMLEPYQLAAAALCGVFRELAVSIVSSARSNNQMYSAIPVMQMTCDLADATSFHSFSIDDGKNWISTEVFVPTIGDKPITQHLIDQVNDISVLEKLYSNMIKIEDVIKMEECEWLCFSNNIPWILYDWSQHDTR